MPTHGSARHRKGKTTFSRLKRHFVSAAKEQDDSESNKGPQSSRPPPGENLKGAAQEISKERSKVGYQEVNPTTGYEPPPADGEGAAYTMADITGTNKEQAAGGDDASTNNKHQGSSGYNDDMGEGANVSSVED